MTKGLVSGQRDTFNDQADHIVQVEDGIEFLNPRDNGIKFVKKLLANGKGKVAKSYKYNWDETDLPVRRETVTLADGTGTSLTVASSAAYPVGTIIRIEDEHVRVTAQVDATTLTIVRGYGDSSGAAHSSKTAINLGVAAGEHSTGPTSVTTTAERLYNYVQQFEQTVEMSSMEIAELSSEMGNPHNRQLERITLWFWKLFGQAVFYGQRNEDSTNELHTMGGIRSYLSTNVANTAGAQTKAAIDAIMLTSVNAGGMIDTIVGSPKQVGKLAGIDSTLVNIDYGERARGDRAVTTWYSPTLNEALDVIVDYSLLDDQMFFLDSSRLAIVPLNHNGINGKLSLVDGTAKGQSGKRTILRGFYTLQVDLEAGHAFQYGLT